jgi:hypothetical protein
MLHTCRQDFFIYVPTIESVETLPSIFNKSNEEIDPRRVNSAFHPLDENWVKIPLDGSIIVYALLREEREDLFWEDMFPL